MQTSEKVSSQATTPSKQRYYKLQLKAWTDFDPSAMDLKQIAERLEGGSGFLTAIEVAKVAEDISQVDDLEVRERFETVQAVEKIMQNVSDIPKPLLEKLLDQLISNGDSKKPLVA